MILIDGHLDLSLNAVNLNRDLTQSVAEIRQSEQAMTGSNRGTNTVAFPEMRRGEVAICVATLLYFWVIGRIDVTQASLSIYLLPVFGVLLSTVVVRERITAQLVFGGLLVFAGTFLVTVYEERKRMRDVASHEKEQACQRGTSFV